MWAIIQASAPVWTVGGREDLGQRHSDKDGAGHRLSGPSPGPGLFSYSNDDPKDIRFQVESSPSRKGEADPCP